MKIRSITYLIVALFCLLPQKPLAITCPPAWQPCTIEADRKCGSNGCTSVMSAVECAHRTDPNDRCKSNDGGIGEGVECGTTCIYSGGCWTCITSTLAQDHQSCLCTDPQTNC